MITATTIAISNKISPTTLTATVVKNIKAGSLRMYGSNLAVLGNLMTPEQATKFASLGQNWARAHHLAVAIHRGWMSVQQVSDSWTNLQKAGVRIAIDIVENLGELTPWGLYEFKRKLLNFDPAAEEWMKKHIDILKPLLKHPALFMVGLVNEGAGFTTPDDLKKFYQKWAPVIKAINPKVMVYSTNDVHVKDSAFINVVAEEDAFCINFYPTEDFNTDVKCSYINEEWHYKGVKWLVDWLKGNGTPKPVFVTEFGSWSVNPFYLENEMSMHLTAAQENWSTAVYAYSTGSADDKYSIESDEDRLHSLNFGGYLNKNRAGLSTVQADSKFSATGDKVLMPDRSIVKVGSYIFRTDNCPAWARITRVL